MKFDAVKSIVKRNGFLKTHALALTRSRHPVANILHLSRNLIFSRVFSRTLVSYERLLNAYELAWTVEREKLDGAYVECGVWRGGVAALIALVAQRAGNERKTHLFDSFEGLPRPTTEDKYQAHGYQLRQSDNDLTPIKLYEASMEDVMDFCFNQLNLDPTRVIFHKGWFEQSLLQARSEIGPIALLRIDADWYKSVRVCLEELYPQVVEGGYVILDDLGLYPGCNYALEEYCRRNGLNLEIHPIEVGIGGWFRKPKLQPQAESNSPGAR